MSVFVQQGYADLINTSVNDTDTTTITNQLTLSYLPPYGILEVDSGSNVISTNLTNGQILIGSTGAAPVAATIHGTTNQVNVTNAAGSITLGTPQNIDTTATPTFGSMTIYSGGTSTTYSCLTAGGGSSWNHTDLVGATWKDNIGGGFVRVSNQVVTNNNVLDDGIGNSNIHSNLTVNGLSASLPVHTNASKQLVTGAISLTSDVSGTLPIANGGTNSTIALTNGKIMVSSGGSIIEGTSATTPTFMSVNISGLTANKPVLTDVSDNLVSGNISLTSQVTGILSIANGGTNSSTVLANGKIMVSSGGAIVEGTSSTNPVFTGVNISGLTASKPVLTDASDNLVSGNISLTSQVTGVLPIANGGTNSNTTLANGKLMASSGGAIVEGTSSTQPVFQQMTLDYTTPAIVFQSTTGGGTYTIEMTSPPATSRNISFPSPGPGADCYFVVSEAVSGSTINGTRTFGSAPIWSALSTSSLLATDSGKTMQSVTISNSNGCNTSFSGSTLTCSMSQDVSTSGAPTWTSATLSSTNPVLKVVNSAGNTNRASLSLDGQNLGVDFLIQQSNSGLGVLENFAGGITLIPHSSGVITLSGSVYLPTSGGTASALNYYEEYNWSTTIATGLTTTPSFNVIFTRIGRAVTCTWYELSGSLTGSGSSYYLGTGSLPSRFAPITASVLNPCVVYNNSVQGVGVLEVSSAGLFFYADPTLSTTKYTGSCNIIQGSCSWNIY